MTCEHFEANVVDVARDGARDPMTDPRTRDAAHTHVEACVACALLLAEQRSLTAGLRELATSQQSEAAPERVEAGLLVAFRRRAAEASPRGTSTRRLIGATAGRAGRIKLKWAIAAVALAILCAVAVSSVRSRRPLSPGQQPDVSEAHATPRQPESPTNQAGISATAQKDNEPVGAAAQREDRWRRRTRERYAANHPAAGGRDVYGATKEGEAEITTDFIPVMGAADLPAPDSGQVFRVELPRSALLRFGLPMNTERANARIKADVLVGNDGVARAIRFVH